MDRTMLTRQSLDKMKVPAGAGILLIGNTGDKTGFTAPHVEGYNIETGISTGKNYDLIVVLASEEAEMRQNLQKILPVMDNRTRLWLCFPKKNSGISSDLSRERIWDVGKDYNHRPVSQIALNDAWTAIRIRPESEVQIKHRAEIPGVDNGNRTVTPPDDLMKALEESGLGASFEKLSFTHKKEHVEAIVTAKKPETRANRILKCLQMLQK